MNIDKELDIMNTIDESIEHLEKFDNIISEFTDAKILLKTAKTCVIDGIEKMRELEKAAKNNPGNPPIGGIAILAIE